MPGRREHDGGVGHSFGLELDGVRVAVLTEVTGLAWEREVIEMRDGADPGVTRHLPGRIKAGEVTLTRGLTADRTFEQWLRDPVPAVGQPRRTVALVVFDDRGRALVTFRLVNAWPSKLEIGGLRASGGAVLTEQLTLVSEAIERA